VQIPKTHHSQGQVLAAEQQPDAGSVAGGAGKSLPAACVAKSLLMNDLQNETGF
jgi:hypothetical protein